MQKVTLGSGSAARHGLPRSFMMQRVLRMFYPNDGGLVVNGNVVDETSLGNAVDGLNDDGTYPVTDFLSGKVQQVKGSEVKNSFNQPSSAFYILNNRGTWYRVTVQDYAALMHYGANRSPLVH